MTTSYPLSLRLKELGVEQTGLFYWTKKRKLLYHTSTLSYLNVEISCRALTLGELVRELVLINDIDMGVYQCSASKTMTEVVIHQNTPKKRTLNTTPEEAAGELLAEIKSQEKQKA